MSTKPILFSGDMIRALLDGRKTQTRRVVRPQPPEDTAPINGPEMYEPVTIDKHGDEVPGKPIFGIYDDDGEWGIKCPYGQPGDLLWVRETWMPDPSRDDDAWDDNTMSAFEWDGCGMPLSGIPHELCVPGNAIYRADPKWHGPNISIGGWKPSIHMPRWASRITLRITEVRVQRVQNIGYADIVAEGVGRLLDEQQTDAEHINNTRDDFAQLWNSINTKPGTTWGDNPWLWALTFGVTQQNIDTL